MLNVVSLPVVSSQSERSQNGGDVAGAETAMNCVGVAALANGVVDASNSINALVSSRQPSVHWAADLEHYPTKFHTPLLASTPAKPCLKPRAQAGEAQVMALSEQQGTAADMMVRDAAPVPRQLWYCCTGAQQRPSLRMSGTKRSRLSTCM